MGGLEHLTAFEFHKGTAIHRSILSCHRPEPAPCEFRMVSNYTKNFEIQSPAPFFLAKAMTSQVLYSYCNNRISIFSEFK